MNPAVCILAAGEGRRMGRLTGFVNKALLPIDNRAVLSHIIDSFPASADLVIAVGYKSESLIEYVRAAHSDRSVTFVEVENVSGPGSGPGLSLSMCRGQLQRPFWFVTADCIVRNPVPALDRNWVGVSEISREARSEYSTVSVVDGRVAGFCNKGADGHSHAYIGMCGVVDFEAYWATFDGCALPDAHVEVFGQPGVTWAAEPMEWVDTGTEINYEFADKLLSKRQAYELRKDTREITYRLPGKLVKLADPAVTAARVRRAALLAPHVPPLTFGGDHLFAYDWVDGDILYLLNDFEVNCRFINWYGGEFLSRSRATSDPDFRAACDRFYREKTHERVGRFLSQGRGLARPLTINRVDCPAVAVQLDAVDWPSLAAGREGPFHGDLNFGNVVCGRDGRFWLIDWRDTFAGREATGDVYYDLGKLYAGLEVNWHLVSQDGYFVREASGRVEALHDSTPAQRMSRQYLEQWLADGGYDVDKVKTIAALVVLNMSPLHPGRVGDFLFLYGRYMLARNS
jgi:choline kinase